MLFIFSSTNERFQLIIFWKTEWKWVRLNKIGNKHMILTWEFWNRTSYQQTRLIEIHFFVEMTDAAVETLEGDLYGGNFPHSTDFEFDRIKCSYMCFSARLHIVLWNTKTNCCPWLKHGDFQWWWGREIKIQLTFNASHRILFQILFISIK